MQRLAVCSLLIAALAAFAADSRAQSFRELLDQVETAFQTGDKATAREKLQAAMALLPGMKKEPIQAAFPPAPEGWTASPITVRRSTLQGEERPREYIDASREYRKDNQHAYLVVRLDQSADSLYASESNYEETAEEAEELKDDPDRDETVEMVEREGFKGFKRTRRDGAGTMVTYLSSGLEIVLSGEPAAFEVIHKSLSLAAFKKAFGQ